MEFQSLGPIKYIPILGNFLFANLTDPRKNHVLEIYGDYTRLYKTIKKSSDNHLSFRKLG